MTLQERLDDALQRSVKLYLQRQNIEAQRNQLTMAAQQCEMALVKTDGEIETLTAQIEQGTS